MTEICIQCPYRNLTKDQQRIFRVLLSIYPDRIGREDLCDRLSLNDRTLMVQVCLMRRRLVGWSIPLASKRRGYRLIKVTADRFYRPGGLRGSPKERTHQRGD